MKIEQRLGVEFITCDDIETKQDTEKRDEYEVKKHISTLCSMLESELISNIDKYKETRKQGNETIVSIQVGILKSET